MRPIGAHWTHPTLIKKKSMVSTKQRKEESNIGAGSTGPDVINMLTKFKLSLNGASGYGRLIFNFNTCPPNRSSVSMAITLKLLG